MAIQKGIVKFQGAMGGITFKLTKSGYIAHENRAISGARIKTDPKFARTRENCEEFGRACADSKMLRKALREFVNRSKDANMATRLTGQMIKVIKADPKSLRGKRNSMDGNLQVLKGFEFNINAPLERTLSAPYTVTIDRATGDTKIDIAAFSPRDFIVAPPGATHCRIISAGTMVDFETETLSTATTRSQPIELSGINNASFHGINNVPANTTAPIFVLLGIEFYEHINGAQYPLMNGAFNTLSIVAVSGGQRAVQLKSAEAVSEAADAKPAATEGVSPTEDQVS